MSARRSTRSSRPCPGTMPDSELMGPSSSAPGPATSWTRSPTRSRCRTSAMTKTHRALTAPPFWWQRGRCRPVGMQPAGRVARWSRPWPEPPRVTCTPNTAVITRVTNSAQRYASHVQGSRWSMSTPVTRMLSRKADQPPSERRSEPPSGKPRGHPVRFLPLQRDRVQPQPDGRHPEREYITPLETRTLTGRDLAPPTTRTPSTQDPVELRSPVRLPLRHHSMNPRASHRVADPPPNHH